MAHGWHRAVRWKMHHSNLYNWPAKSSKCPVPDARYATRSPKSRATEYTSSSSKTLLEELVKESKHYTRLKTNSKRKTQEHMEETLQVFYSPETAQNFTNSMIKNLVVMSFPCIIMSCIERPPSQYIRSCYTLYNDHKPHKNEKSDQ